MTELQKFEKSFLINEKLNILLVGNGENVEYFQSSKYLNKFYTTSETIFDGVINIRFNTFRELARKCKALQIDLVLVEEQKWINEGIADVLRSNHINCIAPYAKWTQLGLSNIFAREILEKYQIDVPQTTMLPVEFPVIMKGDGVLKKANSLQEVIKIKEDISAKFPAISQNLYIEKYLDGKKFKITSIYDSKHLLTFECKGIPQEILNSYSLKLENMLQKEKADFMGFINSEVILYDGKLYNTGFSFEFRQSACNLDILYVLWLVLYQKLDEIML